MAENSNLHIGDTNKMHMCESIDIPGDGEDSVKDAMSILIQKLLVENMKLKKEIKLMKASRDAAKEVTRKCKTDTEILDENVIVSKISSTPDSLDRRNSGWTYKKFRIRKDSYSANGENAELQRDGCTKDFGKKSKENPKEQDGAKEKQVNAKFRSNVADGTKEIKVGSLMMTTTCKENWKSCRYCGEIHKWGSRNCAAYGKICNGCGKQNHVKKVCRSSGKRKQDIMYKIHKDIADLDSRVQDMADKIHEDMADLDMRLMKVECQSNAEEMRLKEDYPGAELKFCETCRKVTGSVYNEEMNFPVCTFCHSEKVIQQVEHKGNVPPDQMESDLSESDTEDSESVGDVTIVKCEFCKYHTEMEYNEEKHVQICQHCYSENDADTVGEGIYLP